MWVSTFFYLYNKHIQSVPPTTTELIRILELLYSAAEDMNKKNKNGYVLSGP